MFKGKAVLIFFQMVSHPSEMNPRKQNYSLRLPCSPPKVRIFFRALTITANAAERKYHVIKTVHEKY